MGVILHKNVSIFPYKFPSRILLGKVDQKEPGRIVIRSREEQTFHVFSNNAASGEGRSNLSLAMPKTMISSLEVLGAPGSDRAKQSDGKGARAGTETQNSMVLTLFASSGI